VTAEQAQALSRAQETSAAQVKEYQTLLKVKEEELAQSR
jgi:hypothetical protein